MNHFGSDDLIGSALQVPPGGPKYVGALPLATLQGLGTGTPVRVSAVAGAESWAWDTTNKRPVYCLSTPTATSSTWGYKHRRTIETSFGNTGSNAERWLILGGYGVKTSVGAIEASWLFDVPTEVKEIRFFSPENLGSSDLAVFKNGTEIESKTATVNNSVETYSYSASIFAANERMQVSVDTENAPAGSARSAITIVLEETITVST